MNLTIWDQPDALAQLGTQWKSLYDRCPEAPIFLSWEWITTWWDHFKDGNQLHVVALSDDGQIFAIAPLMACGQGAQTLSFIGSEETTDYADVLATDVDRQRAAETVSTYLKEAGLRRPIVLEPVPEESPLLQTLGGPNLPDVAQPVQPCPTVALADTWDGYLATLSKKDRHELRRKMRRAESAGHLVSDVVVDPEGLEQRLPVFYQLHQSSGDPRKAQFLEPHIQAFFTDAATTLAQRGWVRLAFLALDGRDVASVLSFDRGSTVALYNSGYDLEFRPISPGIVVIALELKAAIERGRKIYDFLRGDEPYKYDFGAVDRFVWRLTLGAPESAETPLTAGARE